MILLREARNVQYVQPGFYHVKPGLFHTKPGFVFFREPCYVSNDITAPRVSFAMNQARPVCISVLEASVLLSQVKTVYRSVQIVLDSEKSEASILLRHV